ncbi:MAG: hypothetical protein KDK45_03845, partial [Leptospiraceae bacterium]|nr:hypothetical protein [Leptospiraceae bacterium]
MKYFLLLIFLIINCRASLLNRSIGYKEIEVKNSSDPIAILKDPILRLQQPSGLPDQKPYLEAYKESLVDAILVHIQNTGKFSKIYREKEYVSDSEDTIYIQIDIRGSERIRIGYYNPEPWNEDSGDILFLPTFIPGFWPATGYFPLLAKTGSIDINLDCTLKKASKEQKISILKSDKYSLLIYGVYRR